MRIGYEPQTAEAAALNRCFAWGMLRVNPATAATARLSTTIMIFDLEVIMVFTSGFLIAITQPESPDNVSC